MKQKIIFVLSVLFGLMFINAGLNKFFNYMPVPKDMPAEMQKMGAAFMQIPWLMPLTGVIEIIGGILFVIPRTRALGAIVIFPVMIGVLLANIYSVPSGLPIALGLLVINLWVIYENRRKYLPMIQNNLRH
ncbi:DoxX-like family protein [bacterium A37T11]|nr:DoxX-like family protein [bacterium A37T11]